MKLRRLVSAQRIVKKMSKFGTGFGKDKIFLDARPCNRIGSAQHQRLKNQRFQKDGDTGNKFKDDRPDWWRGKRPSSVSGSTPGSSSGLRPPSPTRLGEWQMVWRPNGAPTPPGPKPRAARMIPKSGRDHNELLASIRQPARSAKYTQGDSMTGLLREAIQKSTTLAHHPRAASAQPLAPSRPASIAGSARSVKIEIRKPADVFDVELQPALNSARSTVSAVSRVSRRSARSDVSFRSASSAGTYSGLSGVSSQFDQEEILRRIQGLEDALKAEKNLRKKMQTIIESTTGTGLDVAE